MKAIKIKDKDYLFIEVLLMLMVFQITYILPK